MNESPNKRRFLRSVPTSSNTESVSAPSQEEEQAPATVLLERTARGDRHAFDELYDHIAPRIWGMVLQVVRNRAIAEEVTQEVLVEVWRQAPRFDPSKGSATAWVTTIAHRRAVDRVRSEEASRKRDERTGREAPTIAEAADGPLTERTERNLATQRVENALSGLTPLQREAVELAYFGGNTYREVAALLDTPEGTIKTRIRDGLIRLRHELEAS